jgi:hypothetical protein
MEHILPLLALGRMVLPHVAESGTMVLLEHLTASIKAST